jgi:HPr kinase/phosphorylase
LRFLEKLPVSDQKKFVRRKAVGGVVIIIFSGDLSIPSPVVDEAKGEKIALMNSPLSRKKCQEVVERLGIASKDKIIPGGLLEIFDMGVLIVGDSGVGKSESALELISRGHRFVSDDVTKCWLSEGKLMGKAPDISQNFMEIRGLGIINILEVFGPQAICPEVEIKLVIKLQRWKEGKEYDRIGLKFPSKFDVFGVKVPQLRIPVAPGRTLSNLIEVACRVHALRVKGYHAPEEIEERLDRALSGKKSRKGRTP